MNKFQTSRFAMFYTVQRTLGIHRTAWQGHNAFAAGAAELETLILGIQDDVER